jgi:teichoic acid D-alanine hydrolase
MIKTSFTLVLLIFSRLTFGQNEIRNMLKEEHQNRMFNGVVLLASDGKIDQVEAIGFSNLATRTPFKAEDKFKIASVTKLFTAILVMKLVEEGKLNLHHTIGEYFPDYTGEAKEKVTIHHLLTYSSGIEKKLQDLGMKPYQTRISLKEFIDTYCSESLVELPGTKSIYSNIEYIILHQIIENVSRLTYQEYLDQKILQPLSLTNTGIYFSNGTSEPPVISTYSLMEDELRLDDDYYPEMYFGSGFLYSTVEDLYKLDQALFSNHFLGEALTSQLLKIHSELGNTAYGIWGSSGWGAFQERFYYRTGGILGATANWIHTEKTQKTIIVLSNTNATNLFELSEKLYLGIEKDY